MSIFCLPFIVDMAHEAKQALKVMDGTDSKALCIESNRLSECLQYLVDNNLKKIILGDFYGYKDKDLGFLKEVEDFIEGVVIIDTHYNYSLVNRLYNLKSLSIQDNGRDVVDLSNFPNLKSCGIVFSKRLKGLESCKKLRSMTINNFKDA